ncbi:MAG: MBL fold metallo-hydrolase [Pyrinomonadaceae bacterium]|nr:MBL fold metallo-hydrolase [Pyrinomonadaceae bacterium]
MKLRIATLTLTLVLAANCIAAVPYIVVLGTAQDAGVPQMGCDTPFCKRAWADPTLSETVSSIALVDPRTGGRWIFDATPDLPEQFQFLKGVTGDRSNRLDGIFLTHAHIGHYTGLMYLGRESMNANAVTTYAMPRMKLMLEQNAPWSQLVSLRNIALTPLFDKTPVKLAEDIAVEPFLVPHRDEFSETVGYRITVRGRKLVFIPDIDKWEKWPTPLGELVRASDHLLIDGTFFADGEIARPMSEVPHPFVAETMKLLASLSKADRAKVIFTHFNHSNPLVQRDKKASAEVKSKGFRIARRGMRIEL